jgi:hypothetical protein
MKTREAKNQSSNDNEQFIAIETLFSEDHIDLIEKIDAFPRYVSRQSIAKFLTKYELLKKILDVNGSIVECGVLHGAGLLAWAKLSSIFEPVNHTRKIIGFDTFEGFPNLDKKDLKTGQSSHFQHGGLSGLSYSDVIKAIQVYDINRPLNHIPKVELIKGDIGETAEIYIKDNPHLVVSFLYSDVDLYGPTKKALEVFYPHMPKVAIIVFDELNAKMFPGETIAVKEFFNLNSLKIQRFSFDSYISYCVIE